MRILPGKGYILALMFSAAFAASYAVKRDLPAQYQFYLENEEYVTTERAKFDARLIVEKELVDRVDGLERDPIEMEENVRHQKQLARPGERVYRIEPAPSSN